MHQLGNFTPWANLTNRWGHPWHSMSSYLGSFPAALARSIIVMLSEPGEFILDPFSGRGTSLLESRLLGRIPLSSDLNPIAVALTQAKNVSINQIEAHARIDQLRREFNSILYFPEAQVQCEDIQLIYHPATLAQLCYLRRRLLDSSFEVDQFLIGAVLGIMHGLERQDGTSNYASISMPNTFSMSPAYVKRYVEKNVLNRVPRNVFELLIEKVNRLFRQPPPHGNQGVVVRADSRFISKNEALAPYLGRVPLILGSPPYLDIVNYAKQNWIRNWFVNRGDEQLSPSDLDDDLHIGNWIEFIEQSLDQLSAFLAPNGIIVLVIGDVAKSGLRNISFAREVIQRVVHFGKFSYVGCMADEIRNESKTTKIWNETRGRATNMDRLVFLSHLRPEFRHERIQTALEIENTVNISSFNADELESNARSFVILSNNKK